jgi:putative tryptophan/tyrosine transport system substrate-binding protein
MHFHRLKRREFITLLGGAAAWPLAARAQQGDRMRRIGVLMVVAETDPDAKRFVQALETRLDAASWHKGRNLEITYRWGTDDSEQLTRYANELALSAPDVLVVLGTAALIPMRKATTTIPIVFTVVSDPVAQGFVESLAHPGGNITGFSNFEPNIGSKWLQLLKEIAPSIAHVGVLFNPRTSPYNALWMQSIETAAPGFGVSAAQLSVQDDEDIRRAIDILGTKSGSGLIVPSDSFTFGRAPMIASLAANSRLPAVYAFPRFVHDGGLISYGIDLVGQLGKAAAYVDRILKGEKAGELPVQGPTHYTMSINLKTARALNLIIPATLLATADEVIE